MIRWKWVRVGIYAFRTVALQSAPEVKPCIVLVVDDEPMLCMLAAEMLEDAGHVVFVLGTAAQAIAYRDDPGHKAAVVVTDIDMPGVSTG